MFLRVEAFTSDSYGSKIPRKYSAEGEEISPGLIWQNVPEGTKSFAIIFKGLDTPDRSTPLTLWLVYNIPATVSEINTGQVPEGSQVGKNDRDRVGYSGPCPKAGPDHQRYSVELYALDTVLDLPDGATEHEFMKAAKGHILSETAIFATYERYEK